MNSPQSAAAKHRSKTRWIIRHPWACLTGCLIVLLVTAAGMSRLTFSDDYRIYFSDDNPELQAFEALENTYARYYNVLFVIEPDDGDVFSPLTLSAVEKLTELAWQIPYSIRVDSISNFQHTDAEADELVTGDLVEQAERLDRSGIRRIRDTALHEPQLLNRLVSGAGHVTGVNVNLLLPDNAQDLIHPLGVQVRELAADMQKRFPHLSIHLTGFLMYDNAFYEATVQDMATLIPAMYVFVIVIAGILLRSFFSTLALLLVIAASSFTALGLAGWLGIVMSTPSATAPTIIMTLAVANCIHLLTLFYRHLRTHADKTAALAHSLRLNLRPVLVTSLTTAIGFLSMNASDVPPFRDLGNIVALGIAAALVYSVCLLPALIRLLPVRAAPSTAGTYAWLDSLAGWVIHRYRLLLAGMLLILPVAALGIAHIELDDDFMKYLDERFRFRTDTDFVRANLTGLDTIEFSLSSGTEGGIAEPGFMQTAERFTAWLRSQHGVAHVNSITDTLKRLNQNMHANEPRFYSLPESRELAAQYLLLYEMSLPRGLDLTDQINLDKSATRVIVTLGDVSNNDLLELQRRGHDWLKQHAVETITVSSGSPSLMFAHISKRNIRSMLTGSIAALGLISLVLIVAFRHLRIGLLSLVPNLVPALLAFGAWGYLVGRVGLASSIVAAIALGIIVDDTVHFLSKYLQQRRASEQSPAAAVRATFNQVGPALVITTLLLVGGFLILAGSGFAVNAEMGRLTALTILIALLADLLFLPALLLATEAGHQRAPPTDRPSSR